MADETRLAVDERDGRGGAMGGAGGDATALGGDDSAGGGKAGVDEVRTEMMPAASPAARRSGGGGARLGKGEAVDDHGQRERGDR